MSFGPNSVLQIGRPAAVKTGTTNDFRDNWTVGYTPDLVVGVWVGNANLDPMVDVTGVSGAGPIWHRFIRSVTDGTPERPFIRPDGISEVEVCALSGLLPSRPCPFTRTEWFIDGTAPTQVDEMYQSVKIDTATGLLATPETPFERQERRVVLDLPASAYRWAQGEGLPLLADLLTRQDDFVQSVTTDADTERIPLQLVSPANNSIYRWSETLPVESQRLPLEAISDVPLTQVTFVVNGESLVSLVEWPYIFYWQLQIGEHVVWLEGETAAGEPIMTEPIFFVVNPPEDDDLTFGE